MQRLIPLYYLKSYSVVDIVIEIWVTRAVT